MKNKIMQIVKNSNFIYKSYFIVGNFLLKILNIFVVNDDKLILFVSFGGKKFDDSPKKIYEMMKQDKRFDGFNLIWAFNEPSEFNIEGKVKIDTFKYYVTALKAKVWVTNSSVERGLSFKRKKTFYLNTWHGTPIKKMGMDLSPSGKSINISKQWENVNVMLSQSNYEADIFSRVFNIDKGKFAICGLPRNDELAKYDESEKYELLKRIGLPLNKKIILYAPTFRDYDIGNDFEFKLEPPINFKKLQKELGDEYIFLVRAHYEVVKVISKSDKNEFLYDVSDYPTLNDLLLVSDILISDYSSIFFDYSILERPMYSFTYDFDEYNNRRGIYFDIRKELTGNASDEEELMELIKNQNTLLPMENVKKFKEKYVTNYGNATKTSLDIIAKNIDI